MPFFGAGKYARRATRAVQWTSFLRRHNRFGPERGGTQWAPSHSGAHYGSLDLTGLVCRAMAAYWEFKAEISPSGLIPRTRARSLGK